MSALAESSIEPRPLRRWLVRVLVALVAIVLLIGLALWIRSLLGTPAAAKRQVAKISILPDTPPPPPPPKPVKLPDPPKQEQKAQVQPEPVKVAQPPVANAPIKMEGEAGDAPSAFGSGAVTQEYKGGEPTVGGASGPVGSGVSRANERLYANTARQLLHDELQRQIKPDAGELTATLAIWIEADGRIGRFELQPSDRPERDAQMQLALDAVARSFHLPPPPAFAQPMRFRVTLRSQG